MSTQSPPRTTRLAPSPTGALHLGNLRTFLITWAWARKQGWRITMRIEDLDGPRVKAGAAEGILETLRWVGLDWDGEVLVQSSDLEPYRRAMRELASQRKVYASELTRTQIESAASAPHADEHEAPFPATLRPDRIPDRFADEETNWRFLTPDREISVDDAFCGPRVFKPAHECGDFVVWTKRGQPAYQLAVVVDDARQGVTDVIRGDDLLPSAARQMLLHEALGLHTPRYMHLPIVRGADGKRLAKRHGDTKVDTYRGAGVGSERLIGLMAYWSGMTQERGEVPIREFVEALEMNKVPRGDVMYRSEDDAWLRGTT